MLRGLLRSGGGLRRERTSGFTKMRPALQELEGRALLSTVLGPTDLEQYMLQRVNHARSDPAAEGKRLRQIARTDPIVSAMVRSWDLDAFERVIGPIPPRPPLAFDLGLIEAARDHSETMLATNDQRHTPPGYLTDPRVATASQGGAYYPVGSGAWATGENIFAFSGNVAGSNWKNHVDYYHAGLMIDWGNPNFGHLRALLAPGPGDVGPGEWPYRDVGIGILVDVRSPASPTSTPQIAANRGLEVGPVIVTQHFGWRAGNASLTGAVYRDDDADRFYTPGEGLGGVRITAIGQENQGTFEVETWASGGYTLTLPPGSYDVVASGGAFPGTRATRITIGVDNVGWDVEVDPAAGADLPVPADYDGDGLVDLAVYRPSTGQWFIQGTSVGDLEMSLGVAHQDIPVPADYDGDGKVDPAVFRPATAQWHILESSRGLRVVTFGAPNHDLPIPADYDGDGKADLAVFRPATAQWFIKRTTAGPRAWQFGAPNHDLPIPADYDGDGVVDLAVFRPATAQWFIKQSTAGPRARQFGASNHDLPVPGDYDGDGKADFAVFRASTAQWFIQQSTQGARVVQLGIPRHDVPIPADYDGDGKADLALFRPASASWILQRSRAGSRVIGFGGGGVGRFPSLSLDPTLDGFARFGMVASRSSSMAVRPTSLPRFSSGSNSGGIAASLTQGQAAEPWRTAGALLETLFARRAAFLKTIPPRRRGA